MLFAHTNGQCWQPGSLLHELACPWRPISTAAALGLILMNMQFSLAIAVFRLGLLKSLRSQTHTPHTALHTATT